MYSYEDRIRAVKLYINLGKRLGATIRQLGYPTKNSLIGWYREYERSQDLRVGYSRSGQKYSDQQKHAAVKHYLDHDRCIATTMRALGYPGRALLTRWIDDLHPEARNRMVGRAPNTLHCDTRKSAAVIELCTRKTSAQEIAQELAVCSPSRRKPYSFFWPRGTSSPRLMTRWRAAQCSQGRAARCCIHR